MQKDKNVCKEKNHFSLISKRKRRKKVKLIVNEIQL